MGRAWTAEMLLTSAFIERSSVTSGDNVLLHCIKIKEFDLLWELIEEYDLPVERKEPPYITTTLLQCAVACSAHPDEVQKIIAHSYNNLHDKNNHGKTVFDLAKDQLVTLELLEQRRQELGFKMLYSLDSVLMKQYPRNEQKHDRRNIQVP